LKLVEAANRSEVQMTAHSRLTWLALTPEPERELPAAVACLRGGSVASEHRRVQRLILHGTARSWRRYLREVCDLIRALPPQPAPACRCSALLAGEVLLEHHRMLIGLPVPGYRETEADRGFLAEAVARLRSDRDQGAAC
jgi:hypothetical protein